jgi:hypothetical protein
LHLFAVLEDPVDMLRAHHLYEAVTPSALVEPAKWRIVPPDVPRVDVLPALDPDHGVPMLRISDDLEPVYVSVT